MASIWGKVEHPLRPREASPPVPAEAVPIAGRIISIGLSLITLSAIAICLSRRVPLVLRWPKLPPTHWIIMIVYVDSFVFVFLSAIIKDLGVNTSITLCQGAIILCLACYLTTKIFIYLFLVEKAYLVGGSTKPRLKDKVYLFNAFGLMVPYIAIAILNFVYRIAYINNIGRCIIGMEKVALIPLIAFDIFVNVYLTILFLVPLRRTYSYKHNVNPMLRTAAFRTFIGTCCTLASSIINLAVMIALKGEPGWICLLVCNADILFSALVLHWITVVDKVAGRNSSGYSGSRARSTRLSSDITRPRTYSSKRNTAHGVAIIDTKVATDTTKRVSSSNESFPSDTIRVQRDYVQEVEMDAMSSESGACTESSPSTRGQEDRTASMDPMV